VTSEVVSVTIMNIISVTRRDILILSCRLRLSFPTRLFPFKFFRQSVRISLRSRATSLPQLFLLYVIIPGFVEANKL
jgi:hypothetical protein